MPARFEAVYDGLYAKDLPNIFQDDLSVDEEQIVERMLELGGGWCVVDLPNEFGCLIIPMTKVRKGSHG